ncbi:MAG: vanadium-dependent haloperoxidase [Sphingomicrobium sp.]
MRNFRLASAICIATFTAAPALADPVCEWSEFAQKIADAAAPASGAPRTPDHDRASTHVALAMFEALNAIDRRYESYLNFSAADARASQEVAAATAAYRVLMAHYPAQKTALDDNYAIALAAEADPAARDAGKTIGEAAATAALASGAIDPSIVQTPYLPRTQPGVWVPTALPVIEPFSTAFRPWILKRVDAVRPAPPPALTSARYAKDLDEVKRLGSRTSKERSADETLMARFRITPNLMPTMRKIADGSDRSLVANARLFALSEMIGDDAGMATSEAKIYYNYWRPITAIRNAQNDGNDATVADPSWVPLINTPMHPEYPCGHCTYAAAAAELLKAEVGNAPRGGVRVASRSIPTSNVQVLPSFDEWVRQVSYSRTLGGVHYRFANEAGEEVGRKVAALALATIMRPLPLPKARRSKR